MANEISLIAQLTETKSGVTLTGQCSVAITKVGNNSIGNIQTIPTASTQLTFGTVTTIGYLLVKNLSATNFISVGTITPCVAGTAQITLLPGEANVISTRLANWYALADTNPVDLYVEALEL